MVDPALPPQPISIESRGAATRILWDDVISSLNHLRGILGEDFSDADDIDAHAIHDLETYTRQARNLVTRFISDIQRQSPGKVLRYPKKFIFRIADIISRTVDIVQLDLLVDFNRDDLIRLVKKVALQILESLDEIEKDNFGIRQSVITQALSGTQNPALRDALEQLGQVSFIGPETPDPIDVFASPLHNLLSYMKDVSPEIYKLYQDSVSDYLYYVRVHNLLYDLSS